MTKEEVDTLRAQAIGKRLDDLVGVKISPSEKATLVKLAVQSPELFEEHMGAVDSRPDMNTLKTVVPDTADEPAYKALTESNSGGLEFDSIVKQQAFGR